MSRKIRNPDNYKNTIRFLALMTALTGIATAIFGELALPAASAFLAALMLFEEKRLASSLLSVLIISANLLADFLLGGKYSPMGIETVLLAFVIFFMFSRRRSKAECVIAVTVLVSVLTFLSFVLEACYALGEFGWDAVVRYYGDFYVQVKDLLIEQTEKMISLMKTRGDVVDITAESIVVNMLDSIVVILPSLIIVTSFAIGGVTLKLFHAIVYKNIDDRMSVISWRFRSTSLFAYFYFVLLITGFFANGTDILAIAILNLMNIFMYVFAYLGLKYVFNILAGIKSRGFAIGMIAIAFAAMNSMAVTLLSVAGAFFTIKENRYIDSRGNDTGA